MQPCDVACRAGVAVVVLEYMCSNGYMFDSEGISDMESPSGDDMDRGGRGLMCDGRVSDAAVYA